MKNIILFLFLISTGTVFGQPVNQTDARGRKTGVWKKMYSNGKTRYIGQFKEGLPYGTFKYYNTNGQLTATLKYYDNGTRARVTRFYNRGRIQATGFYHNRLKDSTWYYYNEETQKKIAEENYRDGQKHGWWRIYYDNGNLSSEVLWKNGLKDGPWREFLPDGGKRLEAFYVKGQLEGDYKLYAVGNVVIKKGRYHQNKMDGLWKIYDESGRLVKEEEYILGWLKLERKYTNGVLTETIDHRYKNALSQPKK